MQFDDRLRTVLALPPATSHDLAVRWRQLVELVARSPDGDGQLIDQALTEIRDNMDRIDERVRIATALAIASLPVPADLVAILATDRLAVAAPVLAGARLTASEWTDVAAGASDECRAFIAAMRTDPAHPANRHVPQAPSYQPPVRQPPAQQAPASQPAPEAQPPPETGANQRHIPSISEVVARIERLRQSRDEEAPAPEPASDPGEETRLFRWECNESGEIDWVEGAPRGALVGQSLVGQSMAKRSGGDSQVGPVERAFSARTPFHDAVFELAGGASVSGCWKISGVPAFDRSTGRFAGYRGVAERYAGDNNPGSELHRASLRELAHEIRTPLNAIIGFAEIICGEYLGPAESRYRERAAEIVSQARLLLTAIEDLDLTARMNVDRDSGSPPPRTDLGEVVASLIPALDELTRARNVRLEIAQEGDETEAAIDREVAQRLILRACNGIIDWASEGETLHLWVEQQNGKACVLVSRPAGANDRMAETSRSSRGLAGEGFTFRLARGLAKVAGVELTVGKDAIALAFPAA